MTTRRSMLAGAGALAASASQRANAATNPQFRGYWPILATPWTVGDRVDEDDMARQIEYVIRCGVQGIVWPQLISEFFVLSEDERRQTAALILKKVAGRLPVVIGVQAVTRRTAEEYAKHAAEHGASAVIALPPYEGNPSISAVREYYRGIASAKLPVFMQNTGTPWGPALPTSFIIEMAKESPQFGYIKEEVKPLGSRFLEYVNSGAMRGIFTGSPASMSLHDLMYGIHGAMNNPAFADVVAEIFRLYLGGHKQEAWALYQILLPVTQLIDNDPKPILVRRGVFKSARKRAQDEPSFPPTALREYFEYSWKKLAPHLKA